MFKKRFYIAVLMLIALCSVTLHAAATDVVQKGGLVYVPDHSVFFADVDKRFSWAVHPIDFLANNKIVRGTADLVYSPEKALTRADFAAMLTRAYNMSDYVGGGSFADVPETAYYSDAVSAAKNLGIISGDEYGKFHPMSALTRQDAMAMLRRTLEKAGLRFSSGTLYAFSDASAVSAYAKNDIAALSKAGVISGTGGKLLPNTSVTRAEMAVMLYRAMMLEPDAHGDPVFNLQSNVVNVCIGDAFYPNVTVENMADGQIFAGLYACEEMRGEGEDFTVSLGEAHSMNQTIQSVDGLLLIDGQVATVGESCDAICVEPYGLITGGLVSTGSEYKKAAASVVDGIVTAVYYAK